MLQWIFFLLNKIPLTESLMFLKPYGAFYLPKHCSHCLHTAFFCCVFLKHQLSLWPRWPPLTSCQQMKRRLSPGTYSRLRSPFFLWLSMSLSPPLLKHSHILNKNNRLNQTAPAWVWVAWRLVEPLEQHRIQNYFSTRWTADIYTTRFLCHTPFLAG